MDLSDIENRANGLLNLLKSIDDPRLSVHIVPSVSKAGGGSLPLLELPSRCIGLKISNMTANGIERYMRENDPPIIGRIEEDIFLMDLRTIHENEFSSIRTALSDVLKEGKKAS